MSQTVRAVYDLQTALPLEQAVAVLAGEQSSGTFTTVARETAKIKERHGARVSRIVDLPAAELPPLPGTLGDWSRSRRARVTIDFPLHNFGPSLPNLLAAVAGNLFELKEFGALKLVDLELPDAFATAYSGPQFGVEGTRRLIDRPTGPLIGTIIKPSIGLDADALAALVGELAEAGIDFIKDDELQGNAPDLPLSVRVPAVMETLHRVADRTGRMPMYAFNITDDVSRLAANHDLVLAAGGNCVMICVATVGLPAVQYLREHSSLPIHGHRAGFGALSRSPQVGIGFTAFQKLARLSGVDHLHTNGLSNKFYESDAEVLASIAAVRTPLFSGPLGSYPTLPVLSSAQSPGLAPATYAATGTQDLLVLAGGGIHGHPLGPAAGVRAMRTAWEAAVAGIPLSDMAAQVEELAVALSTFTPAAASTA